MATSAILNASREAHAADPATAATLRGLVVIGMLHYAGMATDEIAAVHIDRGVLEGDRRCRLDLLDEDTRCLEEADAYLVGGSSATTATPPQPARSHTPRSTVASR